MGILKPKTLTMGAKINTLAKTRNDWANWLSTFDWQYFVTFTTRHELTLPSARRLMGEYHKELKKAGSTPFFWVAERYELKDGYHTHALLKPPEYLNFGHLIEIYQVVSGAKKRNEHFRVQFLNYDKNRGAGYYVSKYITKNGADYDLLW